MGCAGSKLSLPSFSSTPCTEYTSNRCKACKDIIAAHDALLASATAHAEALKGAGGALRVFAGATNIFENPARNPRDVPALAAPAPALALPAPEAPKAEGDTPTDTAAADADAPPAPAPALAPEPSTALAVVAATPIGGGASGRASENKAALEDISKKLDTLFLEMGGLLSRPLQEVLTHTTTLSKTAMPPLTAASCKIADGRFEPIGNSLQKLLIWEQHLKDDTKTLESVRHDLVKGDKKLQKRTVQATKDPTKDLGKIRGAQDKVNEAQARIDATSKAIVETMKSIEQFKLEVLFPQSARLFPLLVEYYKASEGLSQKQKALAAEIAALKPVLGALPDNTEDPTLLSSTSPEIGGGATKACHDATKGLDVAVTKWSTSIDALAVAQRKYCAALLAWVRTTMAIPGDFPKPTPEEMAELRPGPNGSKDAESSFAGLANDWTKAVDKLPEAQLREALDGVSKTLKAAFDQQVVEGKEHKKLDSAKKELAKAEAKLLTATKKEEDCQRAALETKDDPSKAKEHEVQEVQAHKATADLELARTALQTAKNKYHAERVAYEKLVYEECNTAGTALQSGLPEVFQRSTEYASAAAAGFHGVQAAHAPWMGKA